MPRIRSIKPEFWTDSKILDLSDSCALFYIALWNYCDDEGKIENNPRTIAALTARWKQDKVKKFVSMLSAQGRLQVSSCSGWVRVINWSHQRINRFLQPKTKAESIQWLDASSLTEKKNNATASSPLDHGSGSKDHGSGTYKAFAHPTPAKPDTQLAFGAPTESVDASKGTNVVVLSHAPCRNTHDVIALYCDRWREKTGADHSPYISIKDAGILSTIVKRVGVARSSRLIESYLHMPNTWFITKAYDLPTFSANLNAISVFADTGHMVTKSELRDVESAASNQNTLQALARGEV